MALEANAATFNAAMLTCMAAWEVYLDAIAANAQIQIVKTKHVADNVTIATSLHPNKSFDGVIVARGMDFGKKFKGYNTPDVADSINLTVGASGPLFWLITNDANELA